MNSIRSKLWDLRCRLRLRERTLTNYRNLLSRLTRATRIRRHRSRHGELKVQIGGGVNRLAGWLNTDLVASGDTIYLDATKPLPFPADSVDYIFTEHMFEHITLKQGRDFLRETHRVLKPGGKIRIATPDLEFLIRLYGEPQSDLVQRYIRSAVETYSPDPKFYERAVAINIFFYNWGHRFIYDLPTISQSLNIAGFPDVIRCRPSESPDSNLRNIESHGRVIGDEFNLLETMVVEAQKPVYPCCD